MKSLLLDTVSWDLVVDAAGNIAVASDPYAMAQDAASAIKLFAGELWYDTNLGVPYFEEVLGKMPPLSLLKAKFIEAAMRVPGVVAAACYITSVEGRVVRGQVQITDKLGRIAAAGF